MSRCGGLSGRSTAVAAAASGGDDDGAEGDRRGPTRSPGTIARATPATASVVSPTLTTTRPATGPQLSRRSRSDAS